MFAISLLIRSRKERFCYSFSKKASNRVRYLVIGSNVKIFYFFNSAQMINMNLLRSIMALGWKQTIESGKYKLKNEIINMQKSHIHKLESAIEDIT